MSDPLRRFASLLWRGVQEVLVVLVWLVLQAASIVLWIVENVFRLILSVPIWVIVAYVRLRYGKRAADALRASMAESEEAGRQWRNRSDVRLARRVGWPSDDEEGSFGEGEHD
jgi:hypothetical protein